MSKIHAQKVVFIGLVMLSVGILIYMLKNDVLIKEGIIVYKCTTMCITVCETLEWKVRIEKQLSP